MGAFDKKEIWRLAISVIICQLAGVLGSIPNAAAIPEWYNTLVRPSFAPPNWLFAPVWIFLYALMGLALFLIWKAGWGNNLARNAIILFVVQLILNAAWSYIFFGFREPLLAFMEIVLLWVMILLTIRASFRISPVAGLLLIPYLLWVTFAAILNYAFWRLN
jgi:tryptophan-rich sensory protein